MILSAAHRPLNPPFRRAPVSNVRRDEVGEGIRRRVFGTFCGQKVHHSPRAKTAVNRRPKSGKEQQAKTAVVLIPLQARMRRFKTASRGDAGILREHGRTREHANKGCSHVRAFGTRASRSRQPQPKSRVSSGSARCCGTPRDRPRSEARYTRCGPIRCTRSAKRR